MIVIKVTDTVRYQPNLKDGSLISYKTWLKDMNDYRIKQRQYNDIAKYDNFRYSIQKVYE